MAIRYYVSTEEASFFNNNRMGYANSIPTEGNYKVGDFIISSTQENGIFGWVCTVAGNPGEWEVIGSGLNNGSSNDEPDTKIVGYVNAVSFDDARSSVEIGINEYKKGIDFLEVHYNGLLLAEGVHYNISEDGKSIIAIDDVWNENADDTQQMIFRVLKSEGINVSELKNTVNIDSACYEVEMGIEGYNSAKDIIEVHLNGVLLVQGVDYEVSGGRIVKVDRNEAWNPYNVQGQKMFIKVMKNNAMSVEPEDGSVSMDKLADDIREDLAAIDGLVATVGMQNNTIANLNDRVAAIEEKIESGDIVTNGGGGGGGPVKLTYKDNLVEVVNTNTVDIGLPFDKEKDMLEVHIDGLKLAEGVHYNISEDGLNIVKVEGVWNPDSLNDQYIDFRVISAGNEQIEHLTRNVEFSSPMTEVGIGLEYEHGVDILIVHLNGIKLVECLDFDYVAEGNKIVKIDASEPWNLYGVDGQLFVIDVLRNVGEKVEMDDLADDVKQAIEAAGNIDLSGYATKEELNELFQDVDNGKNLIATSIGNPLITGNSTFSAMSEAILGLRRESENETDAKDVLYNMMIEDGYNEATSEMTVDELIGLLDESNIEIGEIKQVACGDDYTFILKNDGSVWSCGDNSSGQLGLGNNTDRTVFTQVTTNINNDVKQIACGVLHTFILKNDGSVWSCGYNHYGQLGLNDTTQRNTFTQVTTNINNDVRQIACAWNHTHILKNDGSVWSCGYNSSGQLGLGDGTNRNTFTQVTTNINDDIKQVVCGYYYTFIIKNDGSLWACGDNEYGQLGLGSATRYTSYTQVITNVSDVKQISCGNSHTFILKNDGSVWACGRNIYGELGLDDSTQRNTFTKVTTNINNDVKQIACGGQHTFILKNDGSIWSCGYNNEGQLGLGDTSTKYTFTQVIDENINNTKEVICGYRYTFLIKNDGTVWSCGVNEKGQLGLGDTASRNTITQVQITTPLNAYEISRLKLYYYLLSNDISVNESMDIGTMLDLLVDDYINNMILGYENNLRIILTDEGVSVTEEDNMDSLITKTDTEFRENTNKLYNLMLNAGYEVDSSMNMDKLLELLELSGINVNDIKQIACGDYFTFILYNDGRLYCSGLNDKGQLGLGDTTNKTTFTQVTTNINNDVKQVACGTEHTIILKNDGTVWSTGYNAYGQLGLSDNTTRNTFIQVTTNINNDVKQIACGSEYTFILKNDGSLWSCGNNKLLTYDDTPYGNLGLGDYVDRSTFTQVTANINNDVKQVVCGGWHTFILKNDGSVWSCGDNSSGQLGLGNTTKRNTFTKVTKNINNDVKQIACGNNQTFILKDDGSVWSCGRNAYGELGLNSTTDKTTFTKVTTNINNDVKQIACGGFHTFILKNNGSLWASGLNANGQLGLGDTTQRNTFTQVTTNINNNVKQVVCAGNRYTASTLGFSFILRNDGSVWSCGYNAAGQLGTGDTTARNTFTIIPKEVYINN